jgi:hypothetical protein
LGPGGMCGEGLFTSMAGNEGFMRAFHLLETPHQGWIVTLRRITYFV